MSEKVLDGSSRDDGLVSGRAALVCFGALEVIALPLLVSWGSGEWFSTDDWDFLASRTGGNLGDLFRGHYGHWVTLPVLAYRLLWLVFGLRYVPYLVLAIVAHLIAAALLRVVMRRAGVGPWVSSIAASMLLFFGSGAENILVAFQITFVGALVFGLTQLVLADHDGGIGRRDWLAVGAGLAGLLCSGVAVTMAGVVGAAVLMRRGWRLALFQFVPLAVAYGIWSATASKGQSTSLYQANSPTGVLKFAWIGVQAAFGRLGQIPGLGVVLAAVLVAGLTIALVQSGWTELRTHAAAPLALLAGAVVFLVTAGIYRSGATGGILVFGSGPEHARQGRYVYLVVALALPALAFAADTIIRRLPQLTIPVAALLLISLPGNVHQLSTATNRTVTHIIAANRTAVLIAPRLPLAPRLPRTLQIGYFSGHFVTGTQLTRTNSDFPTLGWLRDSLPSGRIPSAGPLNANQTATETVALALENARPETRTASCWTLTRPTSRVLRKGDSITLNTGSAYVVYLPPTGGRSSAIPLRRGHTLVALAGPLKLEFLPIPTNTNTEPVVCL